MFQLGLFFLGQPDFQTGFFIARTQIDSSVLLDSGVNGGIQGASPGFGFCPMGGEIRCSLSLLSLWTG